MHDTIFSMKRMRHIKLRKKIVKGVEKVNVLTTFDADGRLIALNFPFIYKNY